jgi:transcriptional regulator with XRE-family HTH domain
MESDGSGGWRVSTGHDLPRRPAESVKGSAFGDQLRRAREARGLALDRVADATRIARRHLEALERSDLEALPAGPFGKGYVRAYAEFLGVDPQPLLEAYRSRERQRGRSAAEERQRAIEELAQLVERRERARPRSGFPVAKAGIVALAVLGLGLLGAGAFFLTRGGPSEPAALPSPPPAASPPAEAPAPPEPARSEPEAPATAAPTPAPRPRAPNPALRVSDHGVGTDVVHHLLVGRAGRFAEGTRVSFWTVVLGGESGDVIRHVWFHEDRAVMRADLEIGGPHWRTYSQLLLPGASTGRWAVEARTAEGRLLARDEFVCVPGDQ